MIRQQAIPLPGQSLPCAAVRENRLPKKREEALARPFGSRQASLPERQVLAAAGPDEVFMKLRAFAQAASFAAVGVATLALSTPARACGGFFCSQAQPVNQAAERIIFADNGDGTVTAVIQILYEGPSENFSWLLPISTVPQGDDIAVASDLAFTRLQAATNPSYRLNPP